MTQRTGHRPTGRRAAIAAAADAAAAPAPATAGRALILTRSPRLARLATDLLRARGLRPETSPGTGATFGPPPALALLDLRLPSAPAALADLRRDGAAVIIALSTRATPASLVGDVLRRGADHVAPLPRRPRDLAAALHTPFRLAAARRQLAELEVIARIGAAIAAAPDLEGALRALQLGAGELTGSDMGVVRLLDGADGDPTRLRVYRRTGRDQFAWESERLAPGSNTARVLANGRPIYARDLAAEAASGNAFAADGLRRHGVRSSLNVPLRTGGRSVGTLHVDSRAAHAFTEAQLGPLQFLADHAAAAVERARLYAAADGSARQAQAAVARFEGVLRAATEYAIIGTDTAGTITLFNAGAERMFGWPAPEVVGRATPLAFLDTTELAARARAAGTPPGFDLLAAGARRGQAETREWTCFRRDGTRLAAMLTVSAMHNGAGALTGYIGIVRDITAQKAAEAELRSVATSARCVLWRAVVEERQGRIDWSIQISDEEAAQRLLNIEVLPGQDYTQAWYHSKLAEDRVLMEATAHGALRAGKTHYTQEFRCRQRDGALLWLWEDVRIEPLGPGRWRLDGVATDITERKQAEVALARQHRQAERTRNQLAAILDACVEAMLLIAPDGRVLMVNRRLGDFFGVRPADLLGRRLSELLPDALRDELWRVLAAGVGEPAGGGDDEEPGVRLVTLRRPRERELAVVSSPVQGGDGEAHLGRLYVLRDVTRERQVDRIKTEFVSLVSHELRTPLTSIKGYADLILAGEVGALTDDQREFLGIVKANADRLVALTNDLLDISRLEAGKLELKRAPLALDALIREVAGSLRPQTEAKRQRLSLELGGLRWPVFADPARAAQILTNLLSNAHKYTPAGGEIVVSATETEGWVRVAVRDSGVGLSPEEQRRLFTRFFRAKNPATRGVGGTGLGLTITRSLVEMHGGSIEVASAPDRGSTFTVTLPLADRVASLPDLEPVAGPA